MMSTCFVNGYVPMMLVIDNDQESGLTYVKGR